MQYSNLTATVAMRELHCFSNRTFHERILLHKKMYLAQVLGIPLGFGYRFGKYGPYSDDLFQISDDIISDGEACIEGFELRPQYMAIITAINSAIRRFHGISDTALCILLASVAYWTRHGFPLTGFEELVRKLTELFPEYDGYIRYAVNIYASLEREANQITACC